MRSLNLQLGLYFTCDQREEDREVKEVITDDCMLKSDCFTCCAILGQLPRSAQRNERVGSPNSLADSFRVLILPCCQANPVYVSGILFVPLKKH